MSRVKQSMKTRITKKNPQPSYICETEILTLEADKIRITFWRKFAYFLTKVVIGSQTVLYINDDAETQWQSAEENIGKSDQDRWKKSRNTTRTNVLKEENLKNLLN